jgi:hypothetical protein
LPFSGVGLVYCLLVQVVDMGRVVCAVRPVLWQVHNWLEVKVNMWLVQNSVCSHVAENCIKNNAGCDCSFIVELIVGIRFLIYKCIEFFDGVMQFAVVSSVQNAHGFLCPV